MTFLQYLEESEQKLKLLKQIKQEFISKFGQKIFDNDFNFRFNDSDLTTIFRILNKFCFNNELNNNITIKAEKFNSTIHKFGESYIAGEHIVEFDIAENFDIANGEMPKSLNNYITIINFPFNNFIKVVEVLCHEMIHNYDFKIGPGKYNFLLEVYKKALKQIHQSYDPHGSMFFEVQAKRINDIFGLNVEKQVTIQKENMFMENENNSILIEADASKQAIDAAKYLRKLIKNDGYSKIQAKGNIVRVSIT